MKTAYVHWNAERCSVIDDTTSKVITWSDSFKRATNKARAKGYDVRIYTGKGSYVLKRTTTTPHCNRSTR